MSKNPSCLYGALQAQHMSALSLALPSLLSGDWSVDALQALHMSSHAVRVLSLSTGEVIGFAEYQAVVDECQLFNIAVLPQWQQRGHGSTLLQAVLDEARAQGLTQCVLEVREHNTAARRLYEKLGFVAVGKRKDYYPPLQANTPREAAILYSLSL